MPPSGETASAMGCAPTWAEPRLAVAPSLGLVSASRVEVLYDCTVSAPGVLPWETRGAYATKRSGGVGDVDVVPVAPAGDASNDIAGTSVPTSTAALVSTTEKRRRALRSFRTVA